MRFWKVKQKSDGHFYVVKNNWPWIVLGLQLFLLVVMIVGIVYAIRG